MWKTVKLGDVCDFQGGSQPPKKEFVFEPQDGYIRFLQIRDFKSDKNVTFIPTSKKNRLCNTDDILIGRYGASVGQILRGLEGAYNVALMKTIPNMEMISKEWLYSYLNSPLFQRPLMEVSSRSAQNGFSKDDISNFELPIPPLEEQERIVSKLDAAFAEIDEAISGVEAKEIEVQKLKASLLSSFFSNDTLMWRETTLGEYYDVRDGTHNSPKYIEDGFPLVTSKNLKNGKIDLTKVKYISKKDYEDINRRSGVSIGDVLMGMIGTIGSPVEIIEPPEFAIKNVALFKTNDEQSSAFLFYFLSHPHTISKMMADAKGATQKFVGLGYLRSFPIFVPPLEVQEQIVEKLKTVYVEIENVNKSILKIKTNYQALKSAILSQELQPREAA